MAIRLLLLETAGCHLCEQAQAIANQCRLEIPHLFIEDIDIADSEEWQAHYAIRIPVLYHPETETDLSWPFGLAEAKAFIEALRHD